mgnify:CR=1 FL=1
MNFKEELKEYKILKIASELAEKVDVEVYVVGGFIRDLILKKQGEDIDFLVVGDVLKYAQTFATSLGIIDIVIFKTFGKHWSYRSIT